MIIAYFLLFYFCKDDLLIDKEYFSIIEIENLIQIYIINIFRK